MIIQPQFNIENHFKIKMLLQGIKRVRRVTHQNAAEYTQGFKICSLKHEH